MKVTMKIKVYALMMMTVAMTGNMALGDTGLLGNVFKNDQVVITEVAEDEDEGWHAEEWDLLLEKYNMT